MASRPSGMDLSNEQAVLVACSTQVHSPWAFGERATWLSSEACAMCLHGSDRAFLVLKWPLAHLCCAG